MLQGNTFVLTSIFYCFPLAGSLGWEGTPLRWLQAKAGVPFGQVTRGNIQKQTAIHSHIHTQQLTNSSNACLCCVGGHQSTQRDPTRDRKATRHICNVLAVKEQSQLLNHHAAPYTYSALSKRMAQISNK